MARIEKSIELDVPVSVAYNQITQFEKFPEFMAHVREVKQVDDTHLHWRAEVEGEEIEWDAEIHEQVPDQRIVWRSTQGLRNDGEVSFVALDENRSRVTYVLDIENAPGSEWQDGRLDELLSARTDEDLQSFKRFIESRGGESGAWRGEVHTGQIDGEQAGQQRQDDQDASRAQGTAEEAADSLVRAGRAAVDQTSQIGKRSLQAVGENFSRANQQVSEFASQAWRSQQAIQSSAFEAANAALRPFREGALGSQLWFSSILDAFDEPLNAMRRFSDEMQHELEGITARSRALLGNPAAASSPAASAWQPRVDVSQRDGQLIVHADLPGIRREDVSVEVENGQLLIRGERRSRQEQGEQAQSRVECSYGSFTRVIPLPEEVHLEQAEASVADGVLEVILPLVNSQQRAHRIEVRNREELQAQRQAEGSAEVAAQRNAGQIHQPQRNAA